MNRGKIEGFFGWLLVILFFSFLFSPSLKMMFSHRLRWSQPEKRRLAVMPAIPESLLQLQHFFSGCDDYLNDHFGYREQFVSEYYRKMRKVFGEAGDSTKVIQGKENWYYYTGRDLLKDFCGDFRLTEREKAGWVAKHDRREKWLRTKGIRYMAFVAPNKQAVYPEYFSDDMQIVKGTNRFDQLSRFVNNSFPDYIVDLHSVMRGKKSQGDLYYKSDTHWNTRGASAAFQAIFVRLKQWFPELAFKSDLAFVSGPARECRSGNKKCGDLVHSLLDYDAFLESDPRPESFEPCAQLFDFPYTLSDVRLDNPHTMSKQMKCDRASLSAIVFRDSFFDAIEPMFSENMAHVIYLWKDYDQQNIEELLEFFQPDIVIVEKIERNIF